ncbi:hypothetical protein Tco_1126006 [Tanacetum coccineum]
MAKSVLKDMGKVTGQREIRPFWNSAQRINHQNKFVPSTVLTRSGRVPVSTAKQKSLRATSSTSTFRPVNIATHTNRVNVSKLRTNAFHKSHSPIRRRKYRQFESSDDDLDKEDASKQGRGSDKIKLILYNFTLCLWMLEAKEESTMAFELIKFIKSMLEE